MQPPKEGTPTMISGKPVQMVYPLKMHGEKNSLPVNTCIEAMRGHGRCHTTRNFEPYSAYNFKKGDIAIVYSGTQKVAFKVGRQYRITPDMIDDPSYQQHWADKEKHSYKELLNFKRKPNVWGLEMEPLGDYIEGKIVPFPDTRNVDPTVLRDRTIPQETSQQPDGTAIKQIHQNLLKVERGVIVHQVHFLETGKPGYMGAGLAKAIRDEWKTSDGLSVVYEAYKQKTNWKLGDVQLVQVSQTPPF